MITVLFAHPYPDRSRANSRLLKAISDLDQLEIRSLYERYPTFDIDVEAEQTALRVSHTIVWQHPMYWYSVPGLLKHWFDKVLVRGFAYGEGGVHLLGKRCLWVTTTGGDLTAFTSGGLHAHSFSSFVPAIEQTARFCGMEWLAPIIVHGAHKISDAALDNHALNYRNLLQSLGR
ncbi:MAG: NAD(P)H-dependent oxidoreductase [Myxococcales bacterium]|nr:NAD(P)H-dependent oxidoreductase [Myxococcales bacterium]